MNSETLKAPDTPHATIGMMAGVSTGKDDVHDLHEIPLGMARFILLADHMRRTRGAEGVLFVGDQRQKAKRQAVDRRIRRTRDLATLLAPGMTVWTEEELPKPALERAEREMTAADVDSILAWQRHATYMRWQTKVVGASLLHNGYAARVKYGWQALEDDTEIGEKQFDEVLPKEWGVECVYGPADRDVDGRWDVPYLINTRRPGKRVAIPLRQNGIDAELKVVAPGIRRVTLDTWKTLGLVILNERGPEALLEPHLATDPPTVPMMEPVTAEHELDEVRGILRQALAHLAQ